MSNINFTNLGEYQDKISNISATIYNDKSDVNDIDKDFIDTHVTANDLNVIKQSLTDLADNVNAINNHLINAKEDGNGDSNNVTEQTITNDLNQFLSN